MTTDSFFNALHEAVQLQVLSHLDKGSLDQFSKTCKEWRQLTLSYVRSVRVPHNANRHELLNFNCKHLPEVVEVHVQGSYPGLKPADLDAWLRSSPLSEASSPGGPRITRLVLKQLQLSGPLPLSSLSALGARWAQLTHVALHEVRLTCPLDCTEPVALDNLFRRLYAMQNKALPHITLLRNQVTAQESAFDGNLLVTCKVVQSLAQLARLTELSLVSQYLRLHNEAVATLSACTSLTHLTLQISDEWPTVTVHGLRQLPASLKVLKIITRSCIRAWKTLAELNATAEDDHNGGGDAQQSQATGGPSYSTSSIATGGPHSHVQNVAGGSLLGWQLDPGRCQSSRPSPWLSDHHIGHPMNGYNQSVHSSARPQSAENRKCQGSRWSHIEIHLEGELGQAGAKLQQVGLAALPGLRHLKLHSSCQEAPEPEDPAEEVPDDPQEVAESKVLRAMLQAAPNLQVLELNSAGPVLTRTLAHISAKVPSQQLLLSCHSRVDPVPLLALPRSASLSLTLKGVSVSMMDSLVSAVSGLKSGESVGQLVALHCQRSHELTDELLGVALAAMPTVTHLTLTTCRSVTCDLVVEVARLRRPIRLSVTSCRLVSVRGWSNGVEAAREVLGSFLVDVRYPNQDTLGYEVAFE